MKGRLTFTVNVEYEIDPRNYPGCMTPDEMLEVDIAGANDDPFSVLSMDADWKVTGEMLP